MLQRFRLLPLLCIVMALFAVQALAQGVLEYKFTKGAVSRYKVRDKSACNTKIQGMELNSDWDAVLRLKVLSVKPNGDAEIEASYESGTMRASGMTHKIKPGEVPPLIIQVSKNGKILSPQVIMGQGTVTCESSQDDTSSEMSTDVYDSVMRALWQEFPGRKLVKGDKWKQEIRSPGGESVPALGEVQKTDAKYNGSSVVQLLRTIDRKLPEAPKDDAVAEQVQMGNTKEKNKILFSAASGQIAYVKTEGQMQLRNVPVGVKDGQPVTGELNVTYSVEISQLPPAASK